MEISQENNNSAYGPGRDIYRGKVAAGQKHHFRVSYKYSDLLLSSDQNIAGLIQGPLEEIYLHLQACFDEDPAFLKSLLPVALKPGYPGIIRKMCQLSAVFNVGPMAAVAGTVNEFLSEKLNDYCENLIIENGGDLYLRSGKDQVVGIYAKNSYFKDYFSIRVKAENMPCGVCASSGTFGHSLSLGKCDLAVVISKSAITADAAATAAANSITVKNDILPCIKRFREYPGIEGLLLIKDDQIGIWGGIELV